MPYATAQPLHASGPPMNLVLYSADRELLPRLAIRLPASAVLHWQDSTQPTSAQDLQRGANGLVLLDFRPEHAAASTVLAAQLQQTQPELTLVAVGATGPAQVEGVVQALRAGLRDVLDLDSDNAGIETSIRRALSPRAAAPQQSHRARFVLLLGVRAGVGTSTLAAHLAVLAQQQRGQPGDDAAGTDGLLMELAQPAGDLALYLNLDSRFHYEDALRNASRIDATLARTAMARHSSGLVLLDRASGSDAVPPSDPGALLQRLRGVFTSILCDAGGCPLRQLPPLLLEQADEIWLVADTAIATLVSLDHALKHLSGQRERESRLQLVVNRQDEHSGLTPEQIARRFELPLLATLPERPRVRAAASHGHLLLQDAPRDPYLRALAPLVARLDPGASPALAPGLRERLALALGGTPWKTK
ncbi:fimbrial protein [Stenotrophomonas sp. ESTM1D_MKCIP4_1]|uniref:AAA family ATPase n=1 Tax=Stenotrophomonas sp. ESTM1D_MKCIP4_1 TaxID=2072414 RepID=UPI000D540DAC|nr:fimbrial protein [Stenotrophomonas sp. ESTM1D_MKCIP4_1]